MPKYEHLTVERCVRCQKPWQGLGLICNECRQIEAIEKSTQAIKNSGGGGGGGGGGYSGGGGYVEPQYAAGILLFAFVYINLEYDWIVFKIIWAFMYIFWIILSAAYMFLSAIF